MIEPVMSEVGTEDLGYSAFDAIHHTGYQPPRQAGTGRPLHEPKSDISLAPRKPTRGLAVTSASRTGGATDAWMIAAAFASMPRISPRPSKRPTADEQVNAGGIGALTEQVCDQPQSDAVISAWVED